MIDLQLFPLITFPTHFLDASETLIDHIFCKFSQTLLSANAGILLSNLSDHCATFLSINVNSSYNKGFPKYVKTSSVTHESQSNLKTDLDSINFSDLLETNPFSNPNTNYNIVLDIIQNLRKAFPSLR